jgi:hypothetical protein
MKASLIVITDWYDIGLGAKLNFDRGFALLNVGPFTFVLNWNLPCMCPDCVLRRQMESEDAGE